FFDVIQESERELCSVDLLKNEDSFFIDFEKVRKELKSCKILLLCSPHNPTGRIWSEEELKKLLELCEENNVYIISDEIHMDIQLRGQHLPILKYYKEYQHLYLVSSCSKTLNVPGLIGSYAIVPNKEIYEAFLKQTRKKDFLNSASIFGMYATMIGYSECDYYIDQLNDYIKENMKIVESFIKTELKDVKFKMPEATYLAWIDMRDVPFTSEEIQDALVHVGKVAIMKGETYGENGNKYLRLNCGCPKSKLEDGLQRFKKAMEYLYTNKGGNTK
ncbi:MAG: aminotransferase class I/II-fold pyridoxal phosphate-dependent enzyme, partial [Longicatena sp.]